MSLRRNHSWRQGITSFIAIAFVGLVGCSKQSGRAPEGGEGLVAKPAGTLTTDDLVRRHRGQTEFANVYSNGSNMRLSSGPLGGGAPESARTADMVGGGAQRAVQESDVFKVGPKGSRLLYLLNNYRGLQVVTFEKGDLAPELLGRVEPTGNYPTEMYFHEEKSRLVVIEQVWNRSASRNSDEVPKLGRLVIYDVSKARDPKIDHVIDFVGSPVDSRMVGNVLYIASGHYSYNDKPASGFLLSFRMDKSKLELAQSHKLSLAVSARENMNILELKEGAGFKYYLIAILSQDSWGWSDRMSQVEVVDMTDPNGVIRPVMTVSAKGFINERSQTSIVGNTLLVTSNYFVESSNPNRLARIAVETFDLPTAKSELISAAEAEYRRLHIEREFAKLADKTDDSKQQLLQNKELGLKGRFVQTKTGLRKLYADHIVTVGDTTGLSANLQDARLDNGLLYAFWVPTNMIDPLDLFDVSKPEEGVKYLGRLQFDGWISRAIPMTFQGRRFVIGLGFINPAVDNERNRRYPQAMIFEIMNIGGKLRSVDVAQLTLKSENTWADFNSPDKMIEVRPTGDGRGEIMFQVYQWDKTGSKQGGKIVQFDLNAIVSPGAASPLTEGGLLLGEAGWLKRVFTNSEIQKINAFSDEELATFDSQGLPSGSKTVAAAHRLELARNIRGFETLGLGADAVGVQIVEKGNYWSRDGKANVTLRVVPLNNPDAEAKDVALKMEMSGSYVHHLKDQKGGIFVVTQERIPQPADAGGISTWGAGSRIRVGYLPPAKTLSLGSLMQTTWDNVPVSSIQPVVSGAAGVSARVSPYIYVEPGRLMQLPSGAVLHQTGTQIRALNVSLGAISAQPIELENCLRSIGSIQRVDVGLTNLGGTLFMSSKEVLPDNSRTGLTFAKHFVSQVALAATKATCSDEVNIPGELAGVNDAGHLIVSDTSVKDIAKVDHETEVYVASGLPLRKEKASRYEVTSQRSLISLKREGGKAVLVDERTLSDSHSQQTLLGKALVLVLENPVQEQNWGGYSEDDGTESDWYRTAMSRPQFRFVDVDADGFLIDDVRISDVDLKNASIVRMIQEGDDFIAVLSNGSALQIAKFDLKNRSPRVVEVQRTKAVKSDGSVELSDFQRFLKLPQLWALSSSPNALSWRAEKRALNLSLGLSGATVVVLK